MTRWGILGTGRIARKLIAAIGDANDATAVAVASRDAGRADATAREWGIPRSYGSYQSLLDAPDVEAVYIALPNSMHAEWAIKAAQAGKHILCEKPLAVNATEAAAMLAAAQQHGVVLMEAFMYRFHPQTLKVQELLAAGAIGKILLVRAAFGFALAPGDTSNVRLNGSLAGGALMDVGCYPVNAARWIMGSAPQRVTASARWGASGVDETLAATLDYDDGGLVQIACSLRTGRHNTFQIAGEQGVIDVAEAFTVNPETDSVLRLWRGLREVQLEEFSIGPVNHYRLQVEGFGRMVAQGYGSGPEQPHGETLDNMRTIAALLESARCGRAVEVEA